MRARQSQRIAVTSAIMLALLSAERGSKADIITYTSEAAFMAATSSTGPLSAPFSPITNSISVGEGLFIVTPGPGVPAIAVSNVVDIGLPSSLMVAGMSRSDFDFTFGGRTTAFGFTVANATDTDFMPGTSVFEVTLFNAGIQMDTARFVSPEWGNLFFGVQSSEPFDLLALRETDGGPQNVTWFGGFADREFFGRFFTDTQAVAEPGSGSLLVLGLLSLVTCVGFRGRKGFSSRYK